MANEEKKAPKVKSASSHPRTAHRTEEMITVEQYRSAIRRPGRQSLQLKSLGLGRIGKTKVLPKIPSVVKLVERLSHLVRVK